MSLTAQENSSDFELIPEGQYTAICYGVVDLGKQHSEEYDKLSNRICFLWELVEATYEKEGKEIRRTIRKIYTNSLHKKSSMRQDLEAWRGKAFTDEEKKGFLVSVLAGIPCLLQLTHDEFNGKKFVKINSIMRLPASMPKPAMQNKKLVYDFDNPDEAVFNNLPQWLQEKIKEADDYAESHSAELRELTPAEADGLPF